MTNLAAFLEKKGYVLYSGGAEGADIAFERGVSDPNNKKIFLPWKNFNGSKSELYNLSIKAIRIAVEFHPAWGALPKGAKRLIARNGYQVLGENLDCPVDMVVCYTPNGGAEGGTGQAIRIAAKYNIPVFNLHSKKHLYQTVEWMRTGEIYYIKDVRLESWRLM